MTKQGHFKTRLGFFSSEELQYWATVIGRKFIALVNPLHEPLQWCSRKKSTPFRHKRCHVCYQDFYKAVAVERYFSNSIAKSTTGLRFNILFN